MTYRALAVCGLQTIANYIIKRVRKFSYLKKNLVINIFYKLSDCKNNSAVTVNFKRIRNRWYFQFLFNKILIKIRKFSLLFLTFLSTWLDEARPVHVCVLFPIRRQCGDPLLLISIPPLPAKQSVRFPRERVTCFVITDDECPCQKTYLSSAHNFNPREFW